SSLRRFTESLAGRDCQAIFDGGQALPLGQEQLQREFARVFRALPAEDFQPLETLQPVIVRSGHSENEACVYLVNAAAYPVETSLSFRCPAATALASGT